MQIIKPGFEIISPVDGAEMLKFIETVGRTCYKSEDKITDTSYEGFVRGIVSRGHEAMIEHATVSVRFTCDRGVSHEIVRHREASYAQESTRYCGYSKDKFGNNITYIDIEGSLMLDKGSQSLDGETIQAIINEWYAACEDAESHYMRMIQLGASAQIARSVLNNSTKTELCMTANLREWRHFFQLRCAPTAHPAMREITLPMLEEFKKKIPVVFDDIQFGGTNA